MWLGPVFLVPGISCPDAWLSFQVWPLNIVLWYGPGCFRCFPSCPTLTHVWELQVCVLLVAPVSSVSVCCQVCFSFKPPSSLILSYISRWLCGRLERCLLLVSGQVFMFPLLSLRGTSVVEAFLLVPVALGGLYLYGLSQELVSLQLRLSAS